MASGGEHHLPVDTRRLAASIELRHPPHAHQRVRARAEHQLLQVADLLQVPCLRRREDPLPQTPYVLLRCTPVNSAPVEDRVLRSVHHADVSWRPTCPSVRASRSSSSSQAHLTTSAPFRVRAMRARIRPVIRDDRRRSQPSVPVSCCLSTAGVRFLVILARWGIGPSLRSAYRAIWPGPQRGCHVPHERDTTGVGAPYTPGRRCSPDRHGVPGRRLPLPSGQSCTPLQQPICGASDDEASTGVHLRSPVRPSPRL